MIFAPAGCIARGWATTAGAAEPSAVAATAAARSLVRMGEPPWCPGLCGPPQQIAARLRRVAYGLRNPARCDDFITALERTVTDTYCLVRVPFHLWTRRGHRVRDRPGGQRQPAAQGLRGRRRGREGHRLRRREGGAQRELLAAPIPRPLLVLGNLAVALVLAALQVTVLIGVAALRGATFHLSASGWAWFVGAALLFAVFTYGVAETLASRIPRQEEYIAATPAVAVLPWFFAGSLFP